MMEHQIMLVLNVCKTVRAHMRINKTCVFGQIEQHRAHPKFDPSNTNVDCIVMLLDKSVTSNFFVWFILLFRL